jgi:DNA-binding CsgD family transcriptional regulator
MAAKPKLTAEQEQVLLGVIAARESIPSDKELARDLRLTPYSVWSYIKRLKAKRLKSVTSDTTGGDTMQV